MESVLPPLYGNFNSHPHHHYREKKKKKERKYQLAERKQYTNEKNLASRNFMNEYDNTALIPFSSKREWQYLLPLRMGLTKQVTTIIC